MAAHPNDIIDVLSRSPSENPYVDGEVPVLGTPYTKGPARALWVGGTGDVGAVMWPSGTSIASVGFVAVPDGTELRIATTSLILLSTNTWLDLTAYVVGDVVVDTVVNYVCIQGHTSAAANDRPGVGTNYLDFWVPQIHTTATALVALY